MKSVEAASRKLVQDLERKSADLERMKDALKDANQRLRQEARAAKRRETAHARAIAKAEKAAAKKALADFKASQRTRGRGKRAAAGRPARATRVVIRKIAEPKAPRATESAHAHKRRKHAEIHAKAKRIAAKAEEVIPNAQA